MCGTNFNETYVICSDYFIRRKIRHTIHFNIVSGSYCMSQNVKKVFDFRPNKRLTKRTPVDWLAVSAVLFQSLGH